VILSNHFSFTVKQRLLGQELRNIYYLSGGGVAGNVQTIVNFFRAIIDGNLATLLVDDWSTYAIDVRDIGEAGLPTIEYGYTTGTLTGDSTGTPMPTTDSVLVNFRANVAKPNLSRKFLAGFPSTTMTAGGLWNSAVVGACENFAEALLDIGTTISGVGVAAVQWAGDNTYVTGANIMTFSTVNSIPSTQRRRKIGVGM
jgi:hypothetical protein